MPGVTPELFGQRHVSDRSTVAKPLQLWDQHVDAVPIGSRGDPMQVENVDMVRTKAPERELNRLAEGGGGQRTVPSLRMGLGRQRDVVPVSTRARPTISSVPYARAVSK